MVRQRRQRRLPVHGEALRSEVLTRTRARGIVLSARGAAAHWLNTHAQIAPVFLGMALLRTYKFLAFTSVLGDVAVTSGIVAVVISGVINGA